ncbi:MAG TPA: metallophosphoesterase family protein [Polyangiaceae bacterium]|nr:metallophosphoesterase family protein [Polyangiaceae bacterium]
MLTMPVKGPERVLGRVGVIGDVHCEDDLLSRLLAYFDRAGLDAVLCVGDLADGAGDINRTCRLLQEANVHCVTGNHDRWLLTDELRDDPEATPTRLLNRETRAFLESLPSTMVFETRAGKLLLCHGTGDDDMLAVKRDHLRYDLESNFALQRLLQQGKYRFLVGGHTHQTMVRRVRDLILINAGTLHRGYAQTAGIIDFETHEVMFYDLTGGQVQHGETVPFPDQDELSSRVLRL